MTIKYFSDDCITAHRYTRPECQMPRHRESREFIPLALYDAKTVFGQWAYLCEGCFILCTVHTGSKLGTGIGQFLLCDDAFDSQAPKVKNAI